MKSLYSILILCLLLSLNAEGQRDIIGGLQNRIGALGNSGGNQGDSLESRRKNEETTTVRLYFLDSARAYMLDSSFLDYTTRYPIPGTHIFLGNTGSPTRSILFERQGDAGFDPGFHALDVYKIRLPNVPFFSATRPFTELSYTLASRAEQIIEILHTQNLKPDWNVGLMYRMINAPGNFRNQKTNHNSYLLTSWFQSRSRRYNNYFVILSNNLNAGENGGIDSLGQLSDPVFAGDRYTVETKLGGSPSYSPNFFNTNIYTGNHYKEFNILLRQQYDLGRKDSLVTDSTVIPLFYPKLRFENTLRYGSYRYSYTDYAVRSATQINMPDAAYYRDNYLVNLNSDSLEFKDAWKEYATDFSVYQFPDDQNLRQFIKLGAELQLLQGRVRGTGTLFNIMGHAEYRNRTNNLKWDILAFGKFFFAGYNVGDYHAYVSLYRLFGGIGGLQLGFENVNRKAPFTYDPSSNFYLDLPKEFGKENTTHLWASFYQPRLGVNLRGDYFLVGNYLYLKNFFRLAQESAPFNVLRVTASKTFSLGKNFKWHADVYIQQKTGNVEVNLPLLFTRNRIGYEGTLGFRKLNIAIGTEIRYHTPYKADDYSPILGRFMYQDTVTISNLPRVDLYLHLQIRGFRAFIRFENLNTAQALDGFGWTNHNFAAPSYPNPGLVFRFGIFWGFVN